MVKRELLIVRHGKSDWTPGPATDFDRPLNERGEQDAPRIGQWLVSQNITPDLIISSPALRALQTTTAIAQQLQLPEHSIIHDRRLYLASVATLLEVIAEIRDQYQRVMLVGHNPGLEGLVTRFCADPLSYTHSGKLMTTANLVHLEFQQAWQNLGHRQGRLRHFIRPTALP
ncbi:MAG: histidine phosphatase family protein [Gammaproteobacteria bacterium]|jgi:phosphohistidine phosphatase